MLSNRSREVLKIFDTRQDADDIDRTLSQEFILHQNNSSEEIYNLTSVNHFSNETEGDADYMVPNVPASSKILVH